MPTRADNIARRKRIADEMASLPADQRYDAIDDVAQNCNVSRATVISVCREYHLEAPRPKKRP